MAPEQQDLMVEVALAAASDPSGPRDGFVSMIEKKAVEWLTSIGVPMHA